MRSGDWLNPETFYNRTIAVAGWNPRLSLNLAIVYKGQGRLQEARGLLERTLIAQPDYPLARSHLASTLTALGEREKANRVMTASVAAAPAQMKVYPRTWVAWHQLAWENVQAGRAEPALELLVEARKRYPEAWPLVELASEIVRKKRGPEAALPSVAKFAAENWWHYKAFLSLGKLKAQQNDTAGALAALRHACLLDIRETEALNLITRIELCAKNGPAALVSQERALSRQPDEPSQYLLYSEVLMQMGRTQQAEKAIETARRLQDQASA